MRERESLEVISTVHQIIRVLGFLAGMVLNGPLRDKVPSSSQ